MLSAAIERQYSSMFHLSRHYLPVFAEIYRVAMDSVLFTSG